MLNRYSSPGKNPSKLTVESILAISFPKLIQQDGTYQEKRNRTCQMNAFPAARSSAIGSVRAATTLPTIEGFLSSMNSLKMMAAQPVRIANAAHRRGTAAGDFDKNRLPAAKVNSRTTDYLQPMLFCLAQIWGTPAAKTPHTRAYADASAGAGMGQRCLCKPGLLERFQQARLGPPFCIAEAWLMPYACNQTDQSCILEACPAL